MNEFSVNSNTGEVIEIARGISEYGLLAIAAAGFVFIAIVVLVAIIVRHFQYQRKEVETQQAAMALLTTNMDAILHRQSGLSDKVIEIHSVTSKMNLDNETILNQLNVLHEAFTIDEFAQATSLAELTFGLTQKLICDAIGQIKEENNIEHKEQIEKKIKDIINNIYNVKFLYIQDNHHILYFLHFEFRLF